MTDLTDNEWEIKSFFFVSYNIIFMLPIVDAIYGGYFGFEYGIFTSLIILIDFCVITKLISIETIIFGVLK